MTSEGLDKIDREIIEALKENARMSYSDIGERVKLSRVAVRNRIEMLESAGVIQGYRVIVDETKSSHGVSFTLDVETLPEESQNVVQVLAKNRYIRKIYSTTGDCRLHCVGHAPNQNTLDSLVNFIFRNTKGIRKISWHMLLRAIKDVDGGVEFDECQEPEYMETSRGSKG